MDKADFFDRWAPSYDWLLPSVFYQAVHVRLLDYVQLPASATVLELGCGTGKLLNRIAQSWPKVHGFGIDLSSEMIAQAQAKTQERDRLQFLQADVIELPFEAATFEAAFCAMSFLHYPDPVGALRAIARVLKPGGQFYLADFTPPQWANPSVTLRPISPGGVRFYQDTARAALGQQAGLRCDRHVYLLGPVMMSQFTQLAE